MLQFCLFCAEVPFLSGTDALYLLQLNLVNPDACKKIPGGFSGHGAGCNVARAKVVFM